MLPSVVSRYLVQRFSPHVQASGLVMLVVIIFFGTASVLPSIVTGGSTQRPFSAIFLPACSMHCHWLDSGTVFSSMTALTGCLISFFVSYYFVVPLFSLSSRCLKGAPPGSTQAASNFFPFFFVVASIASAFVVTCWMFLRIKSTSVSEKFSWLKGEPPRTFWHPSAPSLFLHPLTWFCVLCFFNVVFFFQTRYSAASFLQSHTQDFDRPCCRSTFDASEKNLVQSKMCFSMVTFHSFAFPSACIFDILASTILKLISPLSCFYWKF